MKWALAGALVLLAATGALLLAGRSSPDEDASAAGAVRLAWSGKPQLIEVPELPRDRILTGKVRNTSLRPVDLVAARIKVFDGEGRSLKTSAVFLQGFAHGLYPPSMKVRGSKFERTRIGKIATVKPGQDLPVTISWTVPDGRPQPVEARFGGGALALPR